MAITFQSILTNDGATKLANATISNIPINITNYKIGDTANVSLVPSLSDIVGNEEHTGGIGDISFEVVDTNKALIKITLTEDIGPFEIGNIGLYTDDDTLVVISTFSSQLLKSQNAIGVVGNRYVFTIPIAYTNIGQLVNFSLLTGAISSWPWVETIADLPDPNLTPFQGYIVRNEPGVNRAILAFINENASVYSWTLDYNALHNGNTRIEIPTVNGNINSYVNNTQVLSTSISLHNLLTGDFKITSGDQEITSGDLDVLSGDITLNSGQISVTGGNIIATSGRFLSSNGAVGTPSYGFASDVGPSNATGMWRLGANTLGFQTAGVNRISVGTNFASFDFGATSTINIRSLASGESELNLGTSEFTNNGTGRVFVGTNTASGQRGGGFEYLGDSTPSAGGGAGSGYFTLFRKSSGTLSWTARNSFQDNDWEFRGNILSASSTVASIAPVITIRDTDSVGASQQGFLSFKDSANSETGWVGFGSNANTDFSVYNTLGRLVLNSGSGQLILTNGLLTAPNGGVSSPTYSFSSDATLGMWRPLANTIGFQIGGSDQLQIGTLQTSVFSTRLRIENGTNLVPSLTFGSNVTTGLYSTSSTVVGIAMGSNPVFTVNSAVSDIDKYTESLFRIRSTIGTFGRPSYTFTGDIDTGIYWIGDNNFGFSTNGTLRASISNSGLTINSGQVIATDGSAATPSYTFSGATSLETGMYRFNSNSIGFSSAGIHRVTIGTNGLTLSNGNILVPTADTPLSPVYSFSSDPNTGMYNPSGDTLAFSVGSNLKLSFTPSRFDMFYGGDSLGLVIGSNELNALRTNTTTKVARVFFPHYLTTEEDVSLLDLVSSLSENSIKIGAGIGNAPTRISMYAAPTTTTVGGPEKFRVDGIDGVSLPNHLTTANSANANIDSVTGQLRRSTSSIRYKEEVVDIEDSEFIYDLRPVSFMSKTEGTRHDGFIAEEVHSQNTRYVEYNADGEPEGVQYSVLVTPIIAEMKKMKQEIEQLKALLNSD